MNGHDQVAAVVASLSELFDAGWRADPAAGLEPSDAQTAAAHRIEAAVAEILVALGEDPSRDGLQETPARVARMYAEVCSGLHEDPADHLIRTFDLEHDEMVMVRDIPVYSLCEHHLLPFFGVRISGRKW